MSLEGEQASMPQAWLSGSSRLQGIERERDMVSLPLLSVEDVGQRVRNWANCACPRCHVRLSTIPRGNNKDKWQRLATVRRHYRIYHLERGKREKRE